MVDRTLPKVEVIHKRVGKQIETFKEKIWEGEPPTANVGSKGGTKRKAVGWRRERVEGFSRIFDFDFVFCGYRREMTARKSRSSARRRPPPVRRI